MFRKHIPGHASYSQPILYQEIFNKKYNAHIAIDDAKALSELCKYVNQGGSKAKPVVHFRKKDVNTRETAQSLPRRKKQMDLKFIKKKPNNSPIKHEKKLKPQKILNLKGIGQKSVAALSAENIRSVDELIEKYKLEGDEWLRNVLPYGVSIKRISKSISQYM